MHPLQPFGPEKHPFRITAELARTSGHFQIRFRVTGQIDQIRIPPASPVPQFKDRLWEQTCFEVFAGQPGKSGYLEFNFSPSGDWANYSFSDYRQEMTPLKQFRPARVKFEVLEAGLELTAEFGLPAPPLELALTAVVETLEGGKSYWALGHTGEQPDFHRRDSFLVRI